MSNGIQRIAVGFSLALFLIALGSPKACAETASALKSAVRCAGGTLAPLSFKERKRKILKSVRTLDQSPIEGVPFAEVKYKAFLEQNSQHEIRTIVKAKLDPLGRIPGLESREVGIGARLVLKGASQGRPVKDARDAKTIVLIHGGPAYGSDWYTLSFDWRYPSRKNRIPENTDLKNEIANWNADYNVLILEQRGSPGKSIPMDESDQGKLDYAKIARLFNPTTVAFDLSRVIDWYVENGYVNPDNFYVLGHSHGAMVMWSYLKLIKNGQVAHKPAGLISASGNVPFVKLADQWLSTRNALIRYNKMVEQWSVESRKEKPFSQVILELRAKLKTLEKNRNPKENPEAFNPDVAYAFYSTMSSEVSKKQFEIIYDSAVAALKEFTDKSKDPAVVYQDFLAKNLGRSMFLNHIMCQPGLFGATTIEALTKSFGELPEPWMQNYFKVWLYEMEKSSVQLQNLLAEGVFEMPEEYRVSMDDVREVSKSIPIVVEAGEGDTLVSSADLIQGIVGKINSPNVHFVRAEGSHYEIRNPSVFARVMGFLKTLGH